MKYIILGLVLLAQVPLVLGCGIECQNILDSSLSDFEKSNLIANLDYNSKYYPDHDFIYDKNIGLTFEPDDKQNSNFIRDAYAEIITVMPSVKYNDTIYVPNETKVLTAYDYDIQIPSDYYSYGYPQNSGGDCKRIYNVVENSAENKVYANEEYQGEGELVDARINLNSKIETEYDINVAVDIDHYRWRAYCCGRTKYGCIWCHTCQYSYDNTVSDNLKLTYNISVTEHVNNLYADIESKDKRIGLNYSDSVELTFQDSSYDYYDYLYEIEYDKGYMLKATGYNQDVINNLQIDGQDIIVKNTDNCKIKAYDFFGSFEKECNVEYEDIVLRVDTDKLRYKPGEIISVRIEPSNLPVHVTYGNESVNVQGIASFEAKLLHNKITVEYKYFQSDVIISVRESKAIVFYFAMFGFSNYLLYIIMKKLWGGLI